MEYFGKLYFIEQLFGKGVIYHLFLWSPIIIGVIAIVYIILLALSDKLHEKKYGHKQGLVKSMIEDIFKDD